MEKALKLIEQHIQWAVLGLAGLFLLFILWGYLPGISTVTSVTVGSTLESPGEIDRTIKRVADELKQQIDSPVQISTPAVAKLDQEWVRRLTKPTGNTQSLSSLVFLDNVGEAPAGSSGNTSIPDQDGETIVKDLPVPPAAVVSTVTRGGAYVAVPVNAQAAPAPAAPGRGVPVTPALPAQRDLLWTKITYRILPQLIDKAFTDKLIALAQSNTLFLQAELLRQEQVGDVWRSETVIPFITAVPIPLPLPVENSPKNRFFRYIQMVQPSAGQGAILQPPFFQIINGDDPQIDLSDEAEGAGNLNALFDPRTFAGDPNTLSPDDRKLLFEYRRQKAADDQKIREEERKRNRQPRGGRGGGGRGGPAGGGGNDGGPVGLAPMPDDLPQIIVFGAPSPSVNTSSGSGSDSSIILLQNGRPPGGSPYPGARGFPTPGGSSDLSPPGFEGEGSPFDPGTPQPGQNLPRGKPFNHPLPPPAPFAPSTINQDIVGWLYDDTVLPEKTYRYRVRYRILNPLFNVTVPGINQNLTKIFALVGEDSTVWSEPVTLQPETFIYVVNSSQSPLNPQVGSARISIYRWQGGSVRSTVDTYRVGDPIGIKSGDVDFKTDWTLAEVRVDSTNPSKSFAMIMSKDGQIKRLSAINVSDDPKLQDLDNQAKSAAADVR